MTYPVPFQELEDMAYFDSIPYSKGKIRYLK